MNEHVIRQSTFGCSYRCPQFPVMHVLFLFLYENEDSINRCLMLSIMNYTFYSFEDRLHNQNSNLYFRPLGSPEDAERPEAPEAAERRAISKLY